MITLERILDFYEYEDFVTVKGFDVAVVGVDAHTMSLVYSIEMCIKILKKQGMSEIDAVQYFNDNIIDAYDDDNAPIFIYTLKD
jgi:hypothetical protein